MNLSQEEILKFIQGLNNNFVGPILIFFLLGVGIYYTVRLRFIQRLVFGEVKALFNENKSKTKASKSEGISSFQALATSIGAQVGTGNLVGVATAIAAGGPGAVFWLWVSAILGMATNYAEAVLGQKFKTQIDGHVVGGPALYIRNGLKSPWLATMFSVAVIIVLGFVGNMAQSNSIVSGISTIVTIPPLYIGLIVASIVGIILIGGVTRIVSFAERVVPIMASLYILSGVLVLVFCYDRILPVLESIFIGAFSPEGLVGGALGITVMKAIRYGITRGLFSNEAGMGSTPHAHAIAKVKHPYQQGGVALIGIGVDSIVCTFSALVILVTGVHLNHTGAEASQAALASVFGGAGQIFIAFALSFFGLTTIVGWYFFGAQNVRFLMGEKGILPFRILVVCAVIAGSVLHVELVWELADTFNLFLVIPNVIALVVLAPIVIKEAKSHFKARKNLTSEDSETKLNED